MTEFGDIEPDDVYAEGGHADPLQVAIRLHEIRHYLAALAGSPIPRWHELDEGTQQLAVAIMQDLLLWELAEGTEP